MRRKQFEKIQPKYAGQIVESTHDYAIGAFVHDNILAVDFYKDSNGVWEVMWRTLMSKKKFCNYTFRTGIWDERKIDSIEAENITRYGAWQYSDREAFCILGDTKKFVDDYTKITGGYAYAYVQNTLKSMQSMISEERRVTAEERKNIRIQNKMAAAPDIPDDFEDFISEKLFKYSHIMYVEKEKATCSRCGKRTKNIKEMKHNKTGQCPHCGKTVTYKHTGRMSEHDERKEVLLIQKQENEIILRYFKCSLMSVAGKTESLHYSESVRTYHNKRIEWYDKRYICYVDFLGDKYWSDTMNAYHQVGYGTKCCLYDGNLEEIKELLEENKYLPITEMAEEGIQIPWKDILRGQPLRNRNFEKLYKAGLKKLAVEYIRSRSIRTNYNEQDLKKFLEITKPMLQYMQEHDSNKNVLEVFQDAKKHNYGLNDTEIFELAEAGIKASDLKKVSAGNRIIKTLHYLKKVKGYKNLKTTYSHYVDYMGMATNMDYDLRNGTFRYPKDLKEAHDKAVSEFYEQERDTKNREALKKYPQIKNLAAVLNEKYGFSDKEYVIVAPKNAADIVEEGRTLHHCVGGDNYLSKHNAEKTFIFFLRKAAEPNERYYTIELDPTDNRILQYYGYNDRKQDKEKVDKVLDKWKRQLKRKESHENAAVEG